MAGAAEDGALVPEDNGHSSIDGMRRFLVSLRNLAKSHWTGRLCHGAVRVLRHNGRAGPDVDDQEAALTHWTFPLAGYNVLSAQKNLHVTLNKLVGSGAMRKRHGENCGRMIDFCGSEINTERLRGSGRHQRRSNSVKAWTTSGNLEERAAEGSPHDLGLADRATWLRETRPSQARDWTGRANSVDPESAERLFVAPGGTTVAVTT
ncbi:hypothetical protein MTO96_030366 [Rhipicephalus appendiculatus]